jgi:dihydrofolate reductase
LKVQAGSDLRVMGSGELINSLLPHNLIDEWVLMIHPLVLGAGRRLFPDGAPLTTLRLADSVTTTTGVAIATYQAPGGARTRLATSFPPDQHGTGRSERA